MLERPRELRIYARGVARPRENVFGRGVIEITIPDEYLALLAKVTNEQGYVIFHSPVRRALGKVIEPPGLEFYRSPIGYPGRVIGAATVAEWKAQYDQYVAPLNLPVGPGPMPPNYYYKVIFD